MGTLPSRNLPGPAATGSDHGEEAVDPTIGVNWTYDSGPLVTAGTTVVVRAEAAAPVDVLAAAFAGFEPAGGDADAAHRIEIIEVVDDTGDMAPFAADGTAALQIVVDGVARSGPLASSSVVAAALDQLDLLLVDRAHGLRFHAGAVECDGDVVIVLGQSGRGKSTLTAALVQAGWSYVTDELVVVEPATHWVHTYARPVELDASSRDLLETPLVDLPTVVRREKRFCAPFGATSPGGTAALLVVLTGEPAGAGGGGPVQDVAAAEAVISLLPLTFAQTFEDPDALAHLGALCEQVPTVRLARGPLSEMLHVVERRVAGHGPDPNVA